MSQQNIHYELTKQRISQSMHTKGAMQAYNRLSVFFGDVGRNVTIDSCSLDSYVWVEESDNIAMAKKLEKQITFDLGAPQSRIKVRHLLQLRRSYEKSLAWSFEAYQIEDRLNYLDGLGRLNGLQPRPPVNIALMGSFWLPETPASEHMKSRYIAWLSPASNTVTLDLEFPFESSDNDFEQYRNKIQAKCPVKLEDKYFYARRGVGPEHYFFRHLY